MPLEDLRRGTCPLCEGTEIVRCEPECPSGDRRLRVPIAAVIGQYGKLLLYVCMGSGHCQWFVEDPDQLRSEHARRHVQSVPAGSPYR